MSDSPVALSRELSRFASNLTASAIPADVLHHAKRALLDHLAVGIAGSADQAARSVHRAAAALGATGSTPMFGTKQCANGVMAALANGVAAHVLDYDDTYNPGDTTVHTSAAVWPAVLAASTVQPRSGTDALVAFVAGFETAVRLGLAAGPSHYDAGWHVTGTVGHVGAAAAAAYVLGTTEEQMRAAVGTGATQAAGMKAVYGSMGKSLHAGKAASDGLLSALLATHGFTSVDDALEGHRGFLHLFSADSRPERAVRDLGEAWMLRGNGFKAYPCGSLTHPGVDAVLLLSAEHAIEAADVVRVDAYVHDYAITTTGFQEPIDGLEAKFSVYHCLSVALLDRKAGLAQFSDTRAQDPEVRRLSDRVTLHHDVNQSKDSATVVLTLTDGRQLSSHVAHNRGTPANPMSDGMLEEKFLDAATPDLGREQARRVAELCWQVEELADMSSLMVEATRRHDA